MKQESQEIQEWLNQNHLSHLQPVFENQNLNEWSVIKQLTIPLLQSIQISLGDCIKLQNVINNKFHVEKDKMNTENEINLFFNWIQKIIQQNPNKLSGTFVENKHRLKSIVKKPPWRGPLEKPLDRSQSSSILETSSKAFIHSDKPKKNGKYPQITKVISFPESQLDLTDLAMTNPIDEKCTLNTIIPSSNHDHVLPELIPPAADHKPLHMENNSDTRKFDCVKTHPKIIDPFRAKKLK